MKRFSLMAKMIIWYLIAALGIILLLNTVGVGIMQRRLVNTEKEKLYDAANTILNEYVKDYYSAGGDNVLNYNEIVKRLSTTAKVLEVRIWHINTKGVITIDTSNRYKNASVTLLRQNFLEETFIENERILSAETENYLYVTVPVFYMQIKRGYITLSTPMSAIMSKDIYYTDFVNICLLLFLPILLLVFIRIYFMIAMPIEKMGKAAQRFSKSDFKEPLKLDYPVEFDKLGSSIVYMGDKLKNIAEVERKFISNVSHDFRSPLTSIKGYIEAIKDGTIPKEAEDKYLDVILFETDRLTKMTSNILELNTFDDKGIHLHISEFDINAMIKQIALTFEGTFKKKRLILNLVFSEREIFVAADQDKIQQVLYNLIDNAIKFSNSDSAIKITTEDRGSNVSVTVKDYGIGIPKEAQSRIWDRFYKTDTSRGKDKKGTGLGLSIVKEIITAHGENISVVSTEGVGTEFSFTLKAAR